MNNLKTNRSVGLYVGLTVLYNLMAIIAAVILIRKLTSIVGDAFNMFSAGSFLTMGSHSTSQGLIHAVRYVPDSGMGGMFGGMFASAAKDMLIKFLMPFIIIAIFRIVYIIYKIVLFSGICKDINKICSKYNVGGIALPYFAVWLLSGITFNIFHVAWSKLTGKRMDEASSMYQVSIKGTAGSHMAFAIMESLLSFLNLLALLMMCVLKVNMRAGMIIFFIIAYIISYILSFVGISNMAGFIRDVNTLAGVYNGQAAYGQDAKQPYAGQDMSTPEQFTPNNPVQQTDGDLTMPVQEWMPNAPAGNGMIEGCMGLYKGAAIPVEGEVVIGRDEMSSNIVIKTPEVSRKHCGIRYNPDGTYTVTDYSSNGIYYKNGEAFPKKVPVICSAGTIVVIARSGNEFILK